MLAGNNITENFSRHSQENFLERVKQYLQLFLSANLSITIKKNEFVGKKYRSLIFEETKCIEKILENETTGEVPG